MSALSLELVRGRRRLGLKGPRAAAWLEAQGFPPPEGPNSHRLAQEEASDEGPLLIARLGASEFFLEQHASAAALRRLEAQLRSRSPGVYPVLREDWCLRLSGGAVHDVLVQCCNVNFAALAPEGRPIVMTLMVGVSVLVVPQDADGTLNYRIWCDPSFGPYLSETLASIVVELGGNYQGESA